MTIERSCGHTPSTISRKEVNQMHDIKKQWERFTWSIMHQQDQASLVSLVESGELSESEAERIDDLDNARQALGLRVYDMQADLN